MQSISICLVVNFFAVLYFATSISRAKEDEASAAARTALSAGCLAPNLTVSEWSDGKQHRLSDYRGKVVVLHFWGTWCLPCIEHIPVWKRLEEEFKGRDVAFLGIHTAADDMADVKSFMKKHDWEHLTAIDMGDARPESATFKTYQAKAVNHVVVIDADGKIFYDGGMPTQTTGGPPAIAKQLGLPGPAADVSNQERRMAAVKILTFIYRKEIEGALKSVNASPMSK